MRLGSGIFAAAIQLTEERGGARRGGSGGSGEGSVAAASFLEFFFIFDLDFDFCWLSSQHFLTCKTLFLLLLLRRLSKEDEIREKTAKFDNAEKCLTTLKLELKAAESKIRSSDTEVSSLRIEIQELSEKLKIENVKAQSHERKQWFFSRRRTL
ncbi:hypothetical protein VNO80_21656 [Phaseolus coccineus]|uniref:Uncharacterized protein n=1 Tax=Phaseolus coccineus TaxID=3886 RepID=A0AAN9M3N3_PHACN